MYYLYYCNRKTILSKSIHLKFTNFTRKKWVGLEKKIELSKNYHVKNVYQIKNIFWDMENISHFRPSQHFFSKRNLEIR